MSSSNEQFQDWFMDQQHLAERCGQVLGDHAQGLMEAAWEASRQHIEVKMPFLYDGPRQKVVQALEEQGLRVAP